MNNRDDETGAEAIPVGEYLRDELEARDWSVDEFASMIGCPARDVSEILDGSRALSAETAALVAAATSTETSTWLNLQSRFALSMRATDPAEAGADW